MTSFFQVFSVLIVALGGIGFSKIQAQEKSISIPSPIETLVVISTNGENTIRWTEPEVNGSRITGYTVQWSKANAIGDYETFNDLEGCVDVLTLSCTHSGLVGGDRYKYRVKATNAMGDSDWSFSYEVGVASVPSVSVPSPIETVAVIGVNGENTIRWAEPEVNGSRITGYTVQWAKANAIGDYETFNDLEGCVDVLTLSCTHLGLVGGDRYKYRVKATNAMGDSDWSFSYEVKI